VAGLREERLKADPSAEAAAPAPAKSLAATVPESAMCRSIKTLHNFAPPASDDEVRASAIQFVRKLSGFSHPSKANEAAFEHAVDSVAGAARELLNSLVSHAPPRDREVEAARAREASRARFGTRQTAPLG